MRYKVHRLEVGEDTAQEKLEHFLNQLEGEIFAIVPYVSPKPGRYICNPALTQEGRFPGGEPVFSVLYGEWLATNQPVVSCWLDSFCSSSRL